MEIRKSAAPKREGALIRAGGFIKKLTFRGGLIRERGVNRAFTTTKLRESNS